jgi:WD40 repeat protein/DNA-binding XRE family transcriptional regulator
MAERLPFYKQLRHERKLRGWSQEDVASKVGCGPKTVLRWENGESLPHPYSQQRLCELFGKNAEELGLLGEQAGDIDTAASPMQTSPTQETPTPAEAENNSSQRSVDQEDDSAYGGSAPSDRSPGDQPGETGKRLSWEYTSGTDASLPALGTLLCSYDIHSHWVLAVAWSPDAPSSSPGCDSRIASAGGDGTVQIWNAGTGQHILTYRGHAHKGILSKTKFVPTIYNLAWSPDGQCIASAGDGKSVHVWDANKGATNFKYTGHSGLLPNVYALEWSPDGTRIASGCSSIGRDKTIHVWDVKTGKTILHLDTHAGLSPSFSVLALAWSPDGTRIASTFGDKNVHLWDATNGKHLMTYTTPSDWVRDIAWPPDGQLLAVANGDHTVQVWDSKTGKVILTYSGHTDSVRAIAWSPDGKCIASASNDNTVQLWDSATGNHIFTYRGHTDWTTAVAWSPDGSRIASASNDNTVHVWQVNAGGFTPTVPPVREFLSS